MAKSETIEMRLRLEILLPQDLSQLVTDRALMRMALEAVQETDWPEFTLSARRTPEPVLRTVTAYCYSVGIFASYEIQEAVRFNNNVRYLCANDFPAWQDFRRFRRNNFVALREALARVVYATCQEIAEPVSFLACIAEAERRLRLAVEADSVALDE